MLKSIFRFFKCEDGAVTVDWVVLTAAVCALGFAAIISIEGATGSVGTFVEVWLTERPVGG